MPAIGDILQNRYEVIGTIKAGGMGAIYEVYDRRLGMSYALKEAFVRTAEERALFVEEAQLLARLSHPILPKVIDHFAERGGQFLVMELVSGDDLEALLQQRGQPFDVPLVLVWADQLLDALEYLHRQTPPVIHRDIKPANLKPLPGGRIKLLDFGIARQLAPGSQTVASAKAYSEDYSPLEQFSVMSHTDARSDIYALAATLYHLLTNIPPPSAPLRAQGTPLRGPGQFNASCPPALSQVILHAMALRPEARFPDAVSFRAALRAVTEPPLRRHGRRAMVGLGLASTALLIGLGLVGARAVRQPTLAQSGVSSPTANALVSTVTLVTATTPSPTFAPTAMQPMIETLHATEGSAADAPTAVALPPSVAPLPAPPYVTNLTALATADASSVLPAENLPKLGLVRYDPDHALDGDHATSWVEGVAGSGIDEQLVLTFARPISVARLGFDVGFDRDDRIFAANNRVRRARLIFSDGSVQSVEFLDQRGMQYIPLTGVTTSSITIVIEAVYAGAKYDDTCIAEVEVWGHEAP